MHRGRPGRARRVTVVVQTAELHWPLIWLKPTDSVAFPLLPRPRLSGLVCRDPDPPGRLFRIVPVLSPAALEPSPFVNLVGIP